jgi:hypothetical protein
MLRRRERLSPSGRGKVQRRRLTLRLPAGDSLDTGEPWDFRVRR